MAADPGIVDARTDMRLQRFDGSDEKWPDWCLRFEAYTGLLGMEFLMTAAADMPTPIDETTLGEVPKQVGLRLWHLLVT
eukprot:3505094-Lingulodinium_polyedra.AAC.1